MKKRCEILSIMLCMAVVFTMLFTVTATQSAQAAGAKYKSKTDKLIVINYKKHTTDVYQVQKKIGNTVDKKKLLKHYKSCGAPVKYQDGGQHYLTGKKMKKRKSANGPYYEWYVSKYDTGNAIHSVLYSLDKKGNYTDKLYHKKGVQDRNHLYKNNWSKGCTRVSKKGAKYIYKNCEKGTGVYIIK